MKEYYFLYMGRNSYYFIR